MKEADPKIRDRVRLCMFAIQAELRQKESVEMVKRATGIEVTEKQLGCIVLLALAVLEESETA